MRATMHIKSHPMHPMLVFFPLGLWIQHETRAGEVYVTPPAGKKRSRKKGENAA